MVVNRIKVYARLKKERKLNEKWYSVLDRKEEYEDIIFHNSGREDSCRASKFRFYQIFDEEKPQEEVFDVVARPVVTSVLQGLNGTIFAYGQTGSGKTYTMTGSTKKYEERGIIPRSLQYIFSTIEKTEEKPTLYISYMEIYNEVCYDLLNPRGSKTAISLEELPRVIVLEDKKGKAHLKNLSVLPVSTEEEAMRLLFLGDTNRAIAETPLNEYSSRSHCIFTIYITTRPNESRSMIYSKLNLVDLAGSERVHKSSITGDILNEAKHINLSLHFLQQVILALSEAKRSHIPYRNSLMTFILKDSLVGNYLTVMVATLAVSRKNIQESISTCKFAQRVSLIKTDPVINEVSDPYQEILLLKNEVHELRKQLANKKSVLLLQDAAYLSKKLKEEAEAKLDSYLKSNADSFVANIEPEQVQYCFWVLKNKIKSLETEAEAKELCNVEASRTYFPQSICKNKVETRSPANLHEAELSDQVSITRNQNSPEVDYYLKQLSCTYEKAKILATALEECQMNISYIREKLDMISKSGDEQKKFLLSRELERQQRIYRKSLMELKELKNETLQLEAGLAKAKAKVMRHFDNESGRQSSSENSREPYNYQNNCCENSKILYDTLAVPTMKRSDEAHQLEVDNCLYHHNHHYNEEDVYTQKIHLPLCNTSSMQKFKLKHSCNDQTGSTYQRCLYTDRVHFPKLELPCENHHYHHNSKCDFACKIQQQTKECGEHLFLPPICTSGQSRCQSPNECHYVTNGFIEKLPSYYSKSKIPKPQYDNRDDYCSQKHKMPDIHRESYLDCHYSDQICERYHEECLNKVSVQHMDLPNSNYENIEYNQECKNSCCNRTNENVYELRETSEQPSIKVFETSDIQLVPDKLSKSHSETNSKSENNACTVTELKAAHSPECQEILSGPAGNRNDVKEHTSALNECKGNDIDSDPNEPSAKKSIGKCDLFLDSDTEEFKNFIGTISLTGDEEVDRDICNFYRSKFST